MTWCDSWASSTDRKRATLIRFNPVARPDSDLFQAALAGAHLINGLSNRDL
jgi:hypothetical protein